jgi:cytochrome d ubiquinol oxidase subunit II
MTQAEWITLIWFAVIAFGILMYVLMDGFVLGIGILFRLRAQETDQDIMMNTAAPIWDGNETWLVLGGAGLFAAFPVAYSVLLPALYLPLLLMLIALIFRGVAFEFRFKADTSKPLWTWAFHLGSVFVAFAQGVVLGAFVLGFEVSGRQYAGGTFDWLTAFCLMTGVAVVCGYALLGATWLIVKTAGELQQWAIRITQRLLLILLFFITLVSLWVPFLDTQIRERWFSWPNIAYLSPLPLLVMVCAYALYRALQQGREKLPFILAMALFFLSYAGLAISIWPNIVPPHISIWDAASPPESQSFMLVGVALLLPVVLTYTAYSYWIFRGKIGKDSGYH